MELHKCVRYTDGDRSDKVWGIVMTRGAVFTFNGKMPTADRPIVGIRLKHTNIGEAMTTYFEKLHKGYENVSDALSRNRVLENVQPQVEANL